MPLSFTRHCGEEWAVLLVLGFSRPCVVWRCCVFREWLKGLMDFETLYCVLWVGQGTTHLFANFWCCLPWASFFKGLKTFDGSMNDMPQLGCSLFYNTRTQAEATPVVRMWDTAHTWDSLQDWPMCSISLVWIKLQDSLLDGRHSASSSTVVSGNLDFIFLPRSVLPH